MCVGATHPLYPHLRNPSAGAVSARQRERGQWISIVRADPDQIELAGMKPVTQGELLTWAAQQPRQPTRPQRPLDVGFWNPMRDQLEMF